MRAEWWTGLARQYRNVCVVFAVDAILLLFSLFSVPGLAAVWGVMTGSLPNFYEVFFLQLISVLLDTPPANLIASGMVLTVTSTFLTILTLHFVVAFCVGYLFQKLEQTTAWSVVNYLVLAFVLVVLHVVVVAKNAIFT